MHRWVVHGRHVSLHFLSSFGSFGWLWGRLTLRHLAGLHGARYVRQRPVLLTQGVLLQGELTLLGPDELFNVGAGRQGCGRQHNRHWAFRTSSTVTPWGVLGGAAAHLSPGRPLSFWRKTHRHTRCLWWRPGNKMLLLTQGEPTLGWLKRKERGVTNPEWREAGWTPVSSGCTPWRAGQVWPPPCVLSSAGRTSADHLSSKLNS